MPDEKKPDDRKEDERKDGPPTPSQKEIDEAKLRMAGGKAEARDAKADEPPEYIPPTPTQAENDAAKIAATGGEVPTDPGAPIDQAAAKRRALEAEKRSAEADKPGAYTTRGKT